MYKKHEKIVGLLRDFDPWETNNDDMIFKTSNY